MRTKKGGNELNGNIINRGKQKQFLSFALGFTGGKLTTHLQIVHVVNSGKDTRKREIKRYLHFTPCTITPLAPTQ